MLINLQNISKYYENQVSKVHREVLKDISLQINQGNSLAIVGPSGSGKSTLLNIIGTLDVPSSGKIYLDDVEINSLNNNKLAEIRNQKIGFVFQMHHLLPQLNLLENVVLPTLANQNKNDRNSAEKRAMELLQSVDLADKIHQRPGQLSGGECQRAAVIRALINQPELILADEPTGSLDKESATNLAEILSKINKDFNTALVLVTHSMELAQKMEKIYELSDGHLILKNF